MKTKITAILSVLLVFALLLSTGCGKKDKTPEDNTTTLSGEQGLTPDVDVDADVNVPDADADGTTGASTLPDESTTSSQDGSTTSATQAVSKVPTTTAEIVALFNQSANKIKTDATKVIKNYEKRVVNEDKVDLPDALEDTGRDMIKKFMADDTEPIVYSTKEDIRNEYIVPDQDYVSKLQPSTVLKATCVDTGSTYEIYLKLKDERNPHAGSGVAAVCDVIEPHEVTEKNIPFIEKFEASYYNCEIKATIDKETGRMVHTYYSTPVVLDMTVNLFGTHDAKAGFTFIKDYTITY